MRLFVKLCGVTDEAGIDAAVRADCDAVGFVFADSPRRVSPDRARRLARLLPPGVETIAVFHHPTRDEVHGALEALPHAAVQTEPAAGFEAFDRLLPVFHDGPRVLDEIATWRNGHAARLGVLLEGAGRGGRGVRARWEVAARAARDGRLVLAGGLNPDNVAEAVARTAAWGVDVSSGVETAPGLKSAEAVERFVRAARRAAAARRAGDPTHGRSSTNHDSEEIAR